MLKLGINMKSLELNKLKLFEKQEKKSKNHLGLKQTQIIIIGNTWLCHECCKIVFNSPRHELIAVITEDLKVQRLCTEYRIKLLTYAQYTVSNYQNYVLFSIANERIFSKSFIKNHMIKYAINYHDSLLPTYAGINSTTWAIFNNEKSHGITWHKINYGIDEGDIIEQTEITIKPDETALSLNLKCTQQAIVLFTRLLSNLLNQKIQFKKQNLSQKSYYGLDHLPQNYGFINNCKSLEHIYRYSRALYFGKDYPNKVASAKIQLEKIVYLLDIPTFTTKPQDINNIEGLYIFSEDKSLYFETIRNVYGIKVNLNKVISTNDLTLHIIEFNQNDWHILKIIKKNEKKYLSYALSLNEKSNTIFSKITTNDKLFKFSYSIDADNLSSKNLISAISLILLRLCQEDDFLVYGYLKNIKLENLYNLIDNKYLLELNQKQLELKLRDFESYVNESSNKKHLLAKDFYYRYNCTNLLTGIGIYQNDTFTHTIMPHRLNFIIQDNKIAIISSGIDKFEINAVISSLKVVIKEYKNHLKQNIKLNEVGLLSTEDYQKISFDWNKTDKPYPKNKTIHQLFEEQVERSPFNIAVVFKNKQLTYTEVNAKANQLSRYLRSITHIEPDTLIALCLDKSLEMIIGIFGILKSGAAYVPIDFSYPDTRIKYILNDTKTFCLLTRSENVPRLKSLSVIPIIALDKNCYQKLSVDNLMPISASNNLAYVIYTSGTTGQPKGVGIMHKSLCNMVFSQKEHLNIGESSRILQYSSISFDASVWEIFSSLSFGSQLHIVQKKIKHDIRALEKYISLNKINIAALTPSNLKSSTPRNIKTLKYLISAGEKCTSSILDKWKPILINSYGTTENTVCMTLRKFKKDDLANNIGKPLGNIKCYVLDLRLNLIPLGVVGELHISGISLARNYLNQPKLTAEKFIDNPFSTEFDKKNGYDRLYKTGDLVRWLPDGNLEYIGRKDTQVKIRGFRIELTEIKSALINIKGIQQAIVINKMINDEQYLFGYYIANDQINPELILKQLSKKLPHYMVPSATLQINEIPLTINGKIDIHALPDIIFQSSQIYVEPTTEEEVIVCQAFSSVLLIEKIGVDDDFFTLGGNSIKAIQLVMILHSNFEIEVAEIFNLRTPRKLAHNKSITYDLLISKLEQIKHAYIKYDSKSPTVIVLRKKEKYLASIKHIAVNFCTTKSIKSVLLTGATGFLGCNLLHQLLTLTQYQVYLCIRAKDRTHAMQRMANKYQFYFDLSLKDHFGDRLVYIPCDLEKERIGLSDTEYHELAQNIDSIMHCAALAKHYGIEEVFYNANVQATIHLLKLCELTTLKDFHYISTYSVMTDMYQDNENIFTEDDELNINSEWNSPYNKTKYLGEMNTIKWRKKGINSSSYRVGNLAFMQQNIKVQENVKDNYFATYVTFIGRLGCITSSMDQVEISPADKTAEAIVKIFDKAELNNRIHHVFNPNRIKLSEMLEKSNHKITIVKFETFINRLITYLHMNDNCNLIGLFLLRMRWHPDGKKSSVFGKYITIVLQNKTEAIFKMINFKWSILSKKHLRAYIEKLTDTFDKVLETPITGTKFLRLKQFLKNFNKVIKVGRIKGLRTFKAHKKDFVITCLLLLMIPFLYVLELLDMITVLSSLDIFI